MHLIYVRKNVERPRSDPKTRLEFGIENTFSNKSEVHVKNDQSNCDLLCR